VYRNVELYVNQATLPKGWNGIERLIKVRRWGTRGGNRFEEVSFYVLSKKVNSAKTIAIAIQRHWAIENELHWVKDVNIGEDSMTMNDKKTVEMTVYLNNVALNILKMSNLKPTKNTFALLANKVDKLYLLFKNKT
jgi:predicted transposase YbfD/YdcC